MVRSLSFEEIKSIYEKHLTSDFHQSEIKPLAQIKRLYENRQYVCFGSFSEEALIAYAFLFRLSMENFSSWTISL